MSKTTISQTRPAAPWLGGKHRLAKRICAIIDADDHTTYAEPFVGMGGVFLKRTRRPKGEMINDASRDVHNLFRILQQHYVPFLDLIRWQITTQAGFERLLKVDPETLTDLQRAARFLYIQRLAFAGRVRGPTFGIALERPAKFNLTTLEPMLEALHERLAGVTVMNMGYEAFITRIDRPRTFFYCDPPYWGCEDYYGKALFARADFTRLADLLRTIKGRFLLSINDRSEIRAIFAGFTIREVQLMYSANDKGNKQVTELLIGNFEWDG